MKYKELQQLSNEELLHRLKELEEELFNLTFQASLTKSPRPYKVKFIRKDIARIKTLLTQREKEGNEDGKK